MRPPGGGGQDPGRGSFWDVPGLGDDVGNLLGDPTGGVRPPRGRPSTPPPTLDARALVRDNPSLGSRVRGCRDALGGARRTLDEAAARPNRDPTFQAWLALMDELLTMSERMTERLLSLS